MDSAFPPSQHSPYVSADGLDCYSRRALELLGQSIETAGNTIRTVASWPVDARNGRDDHIAGAMRCIERSAAGVDALVPNRPILITGTLGSRADEDVVEKLRESFGTLRPTIG